MDMKMWPLFHNGVAAGLRIAQGISQVRMRDLLAVCGACVSLIHSLIWVEARLKLNLSGLSCSYQLILSPKA